MSPILRRTIVAGAALAAMAIPAVALADGGNDDGAGHEQGHHHRHHHRATTADRNHDGLPDSWERRHHLSLRVNQAFRDQDRDGVRNRGEFAARTDPRRADSDRDGVRDGREDAGTVVSFSAGTLVIRTASGDSVTGAVTAATEIRCEDHGDSGSTARTASHGSDDGPNHDAGDDHGDDGPNHDAGDDHGGTTPTTPAPATPATCTTSGLVAGAVVHEAELRVTSHGPIWDEIELRAPVAATTT